MKTKKDTVKQHNVRGFFDAIYYDMPELTKDTKIIFEKVRAIYPSAMIFKDTHQYANPALINQNYCIGICEELTGDAVIVELDYQDDRNNFYTKSEWGEDVNVAWKNAWNRIQEDMLEKFKK